MLEIPLNLNNLFFQTLETLEIVKHDFTEFKTVMTEDTTNLINQATAQFVESTNTASYLLDTFDNKVKLETNNRHLASSTVQERYENELKAIQLSEATYLFAGENNDASEYAAWQQGFDSDANKAVISQLLIDNSSMRLIYSRLVPAQISNETFWCRYFYRIGQFEEEQRKRIKLLERVKEANLATPAVEEEESAVWGDEDEDEKTIEEVVSQVVSDLVKAEEQNEETSESMVTSIKTEDSDDWDKVETSDTSDCERRKKGQEAEVVGERTQGSGEAKSEEWDEWGE